jgi:hypothetical protein
MIIIGSKGILTGVYEAAAPVKPLPEKITVPSLEEYQEQQATAAAKAARTPVQKVADWAGIPLPGLPAGDDILKQVTRISLILVVGMIGIMALFQLMPVSSFRGGGG